MKRATKKHSKPSARKTTARKPGGTAEGRAQRDRVGAALTNLSHAIGTLDLVLENLTLNTPEVNALGAVRSILQRVDDAFSTADPLPKEWWQRREEAEGGAA